MLTCAFAPIPTICPTPTAPAPALAPIDGDEDLAPLRFTFDIALGLRKVYVSYGLRGIDIDGGGFPAQVESVKLCGHESREADYDDDSYAFDRRGIAGTLARRSDRFRRHRCQSLFRYGGGNKSGDLYGARMEPRSIGRHRHSLISGISSPWARM